VLDGDPAQLPTESSTASPLLFGPRLKWPNGRPSQQRLSSCWNVLRSQFPCPLPSPIKGKFEVKEWPVLCSSVLNFAWIGASCRVAPAGALNSKCDQIWKFGAPRPTYPFTDHGESWHTKVGLNLWYALSYTNFHFDRCIVYMSPLRGEESEFERVLKYRPNILLWRHQAAPRNEHRI